MDIPTDDLLFGQYFPRLGDSKRKLSDPSSSAKRLRPLVAMLEGKDCSVEFSILQSVSKVAFCDAEKFEHLSQKVFNEAEGVLVWDAIPLGKEQLKKFKALKCIVKIGYGLQNVDLQVAGQMGIAVCQITGIGIEEAADSTLGLILDMFRKSKLVELNFSSKNLSWKITETTRKFGATIPRIRGKTLGIIGLGRVGRAVAMRAITFGFNVIFYDPNLEDGHDKVYGITRVNVLDELLAKSDCVTLHCGFNASSKRIISKSALEIMRPEAFLVNITDGRFIDEVALSVALHSGRLGGAALDTYESNPACGPLTYAPNLMRGGRTAYFSKDSLFEFRQAAALEMKTFIEEGVTSQKLRHLKNRKYLSLAEAQNISVD
ncbi:unnamed protein product [Orchesella dallaii]|uniref:C-terminal-binding protein n=1 Tax=Orchesella dallaii TaxID=48710 RepID=A0ABP1Q9D3_9HEXA